MRSSKEWRLVSRPQGRPTPDDVELVEVDLPAPAEGQVLVRNSFVSVDPYMRGRMNKAKSYAAPYQLGKAMWGGAVGEVVESRSDSLPVGTTVRTGAAWREAAVLPASACEVVDADAAPLQAYLGALGMPGLTAWVGLFDIADVRPGETVFVSAASGAVGSIVGQLAKQVGCRVIGSAGSAEKVEWLTGELGFDAAFDYHSGDVTEQLQQAAPDGIDVYFENVGGDHLAAALTCLNPFGRVAACGMVGDYNTPQTPPGNLFLIVAKKLTVRGFIVSDHAHREPAFRRHVAPLLAAGAVVARETVRDGIDSAFDAFLDLLDGGTHLGKLVVRVWV